MDTEVSSRHSLSLSPAKNSSKDQPKRVNDKMVKKYSGRGLKTITISGPGLRPQKFKICVGNHPDDIKKWIDERKKRFPRRDGPQNINGLGLAEDTVGSKRMRHEELEGNSAHNRTCFGDKEMANGITCGDGGGEASGLSSLLAGYESSSSSEDRNSESIGKTKTSHAEPSLDDKSLNTSRIGAVQSNESQTKRICKYHQRGNCRHGDSCKFLHSNEVNDYSLQRQKQRISQSDRDMARNKYEEELKMLGLVTPGHGNRYSSGDKVINNTSLLHKLLQRDKERERRLTLQLLRYIVDCDYFQGGDTSKSCPDGVSDVVINDSMLPCGLDALEK